MELKKPVSVFLLAGLAFISAPVLAQDPDGMGVPWCDAEEGSTHGADCSYVVNDLIVHVAFQQDTYSVVQFLNDGEPVARDEGTYYGGAGLTPVLKDLDGDDVPELVIPVEGYSANSDYDVWSINDVGFTPKGRLTTSWWIDGLEAQDGYFMAGEKLAAWEYNKTAYSLTSHGLKSIFTLNTNFQNEPGKYCTLSVSGALDPYNLDEDTLLADCEKDAAKALE